MATDSSVTRRFAAACGLFSQYAARTTAAAPPPPPAAFVQQQQEGNNINSQQQQLTIFYGGMVVVIDGCTPEKAAKLISLAAAGQGGAPKPPTPALVDIPIARNESLRRFLSKRKDRAAAPAALDSSPDQVPSSLFERNKDEEPEPAAKKGKLEVSREEAASWLALGSIHAAR